MTAIIRFLCKVIPAITFIFSGFVKAIDPLGGALKLEDYFVAFNLEWMAPLSMPLAILLSSIEFLLGFYLLLGIFTRLVAKAILGFMIFFTGLTLYVAIFNPVANCGCFGDALTLTNWQTFWKNIFVLVFTIGMFMFRKQYRSLKSTRGYLTALLLALLVMGLSVHALVFQPVIDFRPFKIGNNIHNLMVIPEWEEQPIYETTFILEKDGVRQSFTVENYPYDDPSWVFIESQTRVISEGYVPPLQTFALFNSYTEEVTLDIVTRPGSLYLLVAPDLARIDTSTIMPMAEFSENARQLGIPFYLVTASGAEQAMEFNSRYSVFFEFLHSDESTLLTMTRSNPGLIHLHDGTIVAKWNHNNLPDKKALGNPLASAVSELNRDRDNLFILSTLLFFIILPYLLLTINTRKKNE